MTDTHKRYDRRILKTKNSIYDALTNLMSKEDFHSITITDIAKVANINRKTFYNYFTCIDDVLNEIIDRELHRIFDNKLENVNYERLFKDPSEIFKRLTTAFNENPTLYSTLFKLEEPVNLLQKIEFIVKEKSTKLFLQKYPENSENIILLCEYCISGSFSIYRNWYNTGRQISIEDLSQKVCSLTESCVRTFYPDIFPN